MRPVALALLLGLAMPCAFAPAPAHAEDDANRRYQVRVEMTEMTVNSQGDLTLIIAAENGWAIDKNYAGQFYVLPEVGDEVLVARQSKLGMKDAEVDAEGKELRWTASLTAKKKGRHRVKLKAEFQVCKGDKAAKKCSSQTSELELKVVVKG